MTAEVAQFNNPAPVMLVFGIWLPLSPSMLDFSDPVYTEVQQATIRNTMPPTNNPEPHLT
ncbi:MAG: hypothetical protein H0V83_04265 [Rubrobacter sp.]|nr:hypothetical protein [Rubrobacter sp.]